MPRFSTPLRRIAIVRALHLGDLLLAVPAWRTLRQAFPSAEITLIGLPWAKSFVERYPYLDRFLQFPGYPGMLEVEPDESLLAAFLDSAREYRYDLALQMHGSGEHSAGFVAALGAACSAGYEPVLDGRPAKLALRLPYPGHLSEIHRNLRLISWLTGIGGHPTLEFPILAREREELALLPELRSLPEGARLIGIHPGARPPARRWMPERFAELADVLARAHHATVIVTGGLGEKEIAAAVVSGMAEPAIDLSGRTSLGALAALISSLVLFVSNDSGPAHVAAAVGTPSIAIFGPADPRRWAPLDQRRHRIVHKKVECSPCGYWDCPIDHRCLRRIAVEEVLAVADHLLQEAKAA